MAAQKSARTHIRLLGLDPGLVKTGWGIVDSDGVRLSHVACGTIRPTTSDEISTRLATLYEALAAIIGEWRPDTAAWVTSRPARAAMRYHRSEMPPTARCWIATVNRAGKSMHITRCSLTTSFSTHYLHNRNSLQYE